MRESSHSVITLSSSELSRGRLPGNYSRLKLGCKTDVDIFAIRMVEELLLIDDLKDDDWLVTGLPLTALPSAANLLATQVVEYLHLHNRSNVSLKNLRKRSDLDLFPHGHFANLDGAGRSAVLARSATDKWLRDGTFVGRSVIVVDDVRVTGANERALRLFFESLGTQRVFWAYLLDLKIDRDSEPGVEEPRLNSLYFDGIKDIAQVLRTFDVQPTTRLVWGLFAMAPADFAEVREAISPALASTIMSTMLREGIQLSSELSARWSFLEERAKAPAQNRVVRNDSRRG